MGKIPQAYPMKPTVPATLSRCTAAFLLVVSLLGLAPVAIAATNAGETGLRLLQAEFPAQVTLLNADCEQLAAAVGRATLAHQADAPTILRVALTRGIKKLRHGEEKLPCACAKRIFSVSIAAAPPQASALLDLATELYPDCAAELAGVMRDYDRVAYDYKNVVDDKNGPARHDSSSAGSPVAQSTSGDPSAVSQDPGDLSEHDLIGLGYGESSGFGTGFGAGFPGAPGFVGSPPSGGIALPPTPVTASVNN